LFLKEIYNKHYIQSFQTNNLKKHYRNNYFTKMV
jgi:hypothetical protein